MEGKIDGERRAILKAVALAGTAGAVSGVPLVSYVVSPGLKKGLGTWVDFGRVENVEARGVRMLAYKLMVKDGWMVLPRQGVVWARTDADGKLTIFSSICTHLGCAVRWQGETKTFECPCHSARFDADGRPIAGPPTKPLAVLEHKVENGNLQVFLFT